MSIKVMTAVWEHGPKNSTQRFVLLALADYASDDGRNTYPAVETLAAKCALSERTVIRALEALIHDGYLVRRRRKDTTNLYQIVIDRLHQPVDDKLSPTVSDNLTPTVSDKMSPTEVTDCHPGKCQDVTPVGDTLSPDPSLIHHSNRQDEPSTAAPTAADPPPLAAAAADPLQPILDWIGFDDTLKDTERRRLDVATLLAWAYTVKLKEALPRARGRVYNPVGLARSLWRNGQPPRADLLRLARGWLALSDDGRARLLGRLEWGSDYGGQLDTYDFEADFPDIPPLAAQAVYTATGGQLAPPAHTPAPIEPVCPTDRPTPAAQSTDDTHRSVPQTTPSTPATLWREALAELEMQMTRATFATWFQGTTATLTGDTLTVHVRNHHAVDWLENRLHDLIQRTVESVAGRPIAVRYEAPDAQPEAHHG